MRSQRFRDSTGVVNRRSSNSKRPLALIGHSRGGALARAIAGGLQNRVSHLILLGSPVGELQLAVTNGQPINLANAGVNRTVEEASMFARRLLDPNCSFPRCGCAFAKDIARLLSELTAVLSVFSPDDQIVSPAACRVMDGKNLEISGTHSGLVYNREVYREVARFLAESPR
jgi:triacylglycerol lipase